MVNTFTAYQRLIESGLVEQEAIAYANVLGEAISKDVSFDLEKCANKLFDGGVSNEEKVDGLSSLLRNCFWSERFRTSYVPNAHKAALVRAGYSAVQASSIIDATDPFILVPRTTEIRRPIQHGVNAGNVIMCDFTFLRKPEMQKERRAIVVSPRSQNRHRRCVVVPVSMSQPDHRTVFHYEFPAGRYSFFSSHNPVWAICDHIYTVSFERLWLVNVNRRPDRSAKLNLEDLKAVLEKLRGALGMSALTSASDQPNISSHAAANSVSGVPTAGCQA